MTIVVDMGRKATKTNKNAKDGKGGINNTYIV